MRTYFGTDGIRGPSNSHPMTVEVAMRLGQAVAKHFARATHRPKILIGKDTRLSGYMFESALAAGINSMGGDVLFTGPLPTPGIAILTTGMRADAGIVISASHNPFHDNGIKVFGADGFKLPDAEELALEQLMDDPDLQRRCAKPIDVGRSRRIDDATGRYIEYLKSIFPKNLTLEGLKIVVDCAHGAAYKAAPAVLWELGAEIIKTGVAPDGFNINRDCGSLNPHHCAQLVLEHGADLGVTLDGDADRVIIVDEKGQIVDGDQVMTLAAMQLKALGLLDNNTVVATVMSNLGMERALKAQGINLVRTKVGDRYVVEAMRKGGYVFGGEQSGHLVFLKHSTTGDGMIGALEVLSAMVRDQKPISELAHVMERLPQVLLNLRVREKPPLETLPDVQRVITQVETELGDRGRVLVRYSGTEPKARVMLEGTDETEITNHAHRIVVALDEAIGEAS